MPDNNGLVSRHSNLVNLEARRGSPRPPTLVTAVSADRSSTPKSKKSASLDADWVTDVLLLVIVAALFAAWAGGQ